ncbi:MAG: hypothetical protein J6L69_05160 [Lachnospiraceae bacterium]|nr:hypothetical protein [Lachnospiraceae bacterium]
MKKKTIKVIGIVILSIFLIYTLFITEEVIRLSNNQQAEPLIVFEESYDDERNEFTYKSLGFTYKVEYWDFEGEKTKVVSQVILLFDRYVIWGWIT